MIIYTHIILFWFSMDNRLLIGIITWIFIAKKLNLSPFFSNWKFSGQYLYSNSEDFFDTQSKPSLLTSHRLAFTREEISNLLSSVSTFFSSFHLPKLNKNMADVHVHGRMANLSTASVSFLTISCWNKLHLTTLHVHLLIKIWQKSVLFVGEILSIRQRC